MVFLQVGCFSWITESLIIAYVTSLICMFQNFQQCSVYYLFYRWGRPTRLKQNAHASLKSLIISMLATWSLVWRERETESKVKEMKEMKPTATLKK